MAVAQEELLPLLAAAVQIEAAALARRTQDRDEWRSAGLVLRPGQGEPYQQQQQALLPLRTVRQPWGCAWVPKCPIGDLVPASRWEPRESAGEAKLGQMGSCPEEDCPD
jgi:hypothetical protein